MFYKSEKEKCFAYSVNTACDDSNFVLGFEVTAGNVHDSVSFNKVFDMTYKRFYDDMKIVAVDAGYVTPFICKTIMDKELFPAMPYKRPQTKKGFFKKYEYVYDEYYDCYICPNNEVLYYTTTNRNGYKEYKSDSNKCKNCPMIEQCTESKNNQKVITRHVWQEYVEEAHHLRYDPIIKGAYKRRKETIERVFADGKERHGMRYTRLKGLAKVKDEVTLIFACMNLKKLAKRCWNKHKNNANIYNNSIKFIINIATHQKIKINHLLIA